MIKDKHLAKKQQEEIEKSLCKNGYPWPIIPISAQLKYNIDAVIDYICRIPIPLRDFSAAPQMIVIRSFDVNKPGTDAEFVQGGVAGGTILKGVLRVGDEIAVRPGFIRRSSAGVSKWTEIRSQITTLKADSNHLMYAVPGGLIAVGTRVDPQFTRSDNMVGHIIGRPGSMPKVFIEIDVQTQFLKRLVGLKDDKIEHIKEGEILLVNIGSTSCGGTVTAVPKGKLFARIQLKKHVCANVGDKIALSRKVERNFRLIGWGEITAGYEKKIEEDDQ